MKDSTFAKLFVGGFGLVWALGLIFSLATSGLIIYILYRVATHPW